MATLDPRLTSEALLRLAAWRLSHGPPRLPAPPEEDGLCAILDYARRLPQRDPWDVDSLEASGPFGPLLREARELTRLEGEA